MKLNVNAGVGLFLFLVALLLDIVFFAIGLTGYWIVLWTAIGGCGLLLLLVELIPYENKQN